VSRAVRITLESTAEIVAEPPPARVWRGRSEDGAQVLAFITLGVTELSGDPLIDARMRQALETRIASSAVITIPVKP